MAASVAMKGWILSLVMTRPLSSADDKAGRHAAQQARPPSDRATEVAATTLASAAVPPTERSMPPVMMTSAMPSAISANIEL